MIEDILGQYIEHERPPGLHILAGWGLRSNATAGGEQCQAKTGWPSVGRLHQIIRPGFDQRVRVSAEHRQQFISLEEKFLDTNFNQMLLQAKASNGHRRIHT